MLRKLLVGIALVGVGVAAGSTIPASGQDFGTVTVSQGAVVTGRVNEEYRMPVAVTQKGVPTRDTRLAEKRQILAVPAHYGALFAVTGHGADAVLWYQDDEGEIRNAVVAAAATRLARVVSRPTARLEFDYR